MTQITFTDDTTFDVPADGNVNPAGGWLMITWDYSEIGDPRQMRTYPAHMIKVITTTP